MSDAVIVGILSLLGVIFSAIWQRNKTAADFEAQAKLEDERLTRQSELADARLEKSQAVTDEKLEELTREVREHNSFARRVPILEKQMEGVERRLTNIENS